jgi:hypothetical protein
MGHRPAARLNETFAESSASNAALHPARRSQEADNSLEKLSFPHFEGAKKQRDNSGRNSAITATFLQRDMPHDLDRIRKAGCEFSCLQAADPIVQAALLEHVLSGLSS